MKRQAGCIAACNQFLSTAPASVATWYLARYLAHHLVLHQENERHAFRKALCVHAQHCGVRTDTDEYRHIMWSIDGNGRECERFPLGEVLVRYVEGLNSHMSYADRKLLAVLVLMRQWRIPDRLHRELYERCKRAHERMGTPFSSFFEKALRHVFGYKNNRRAYELVLEQVRTTTRKENV